MKIQVDKSINTMLCNLKHGCRAFTCGNWVSAPGFHMAVAGVLGVAGLVLALVKDRSFENLTRLSWFSAKHNRSEKLYLVPGLQNLGNNCFLNVILQALASCSEFQPFLQNVVKESELSTNGELSEILQLTLALAALLEELSTFSDRRNVLSPRKVMLAMADSNQNFSLTSQQDAEEAFLHLLASLREEFSVTYSPNQSSLAEAFSASNVRILAPQSKDIMNEQEKWQQRFLGPFDGILNSFLTCQTCSSQISLNFQFFHSLPLLPVLENAGTIRAGCSVEDCLKRFIIADQVENYKCSNCWHIAAIKFSSLVGAKETEIETIRTCTMQDSCSCHSLPHLERMPWSNNLSCTLKQLSIARCPKILCIHLQRASVNHFGELVKLQGHVRFPLILNMLPFTFKTMQCQKPSHPVDFLNVQSDARMLKSIYGQSTYSMILAANKSRSNEHMETCLGKTILGDTIGYSNTMQTDVSLEVNDEAGVACPSETLLYRLVSVVEHFGRVGGGHYTVYRSLRFESPEKYCSDETENLTPFRPQWFSISDSDVSRVTEEDVLAAEASLLFYERIV